MSKSDLLARDLLEIKRKTARGYDCPACGQLYHQEPKIWEHAQLHHPTYLEEMSIEADNDVRKRFRQEALNRAERKATTTGKAAAAVASSPSHLRSPPDRYKAAVKQIDDGRVDLRSSENRMSAHGQPQGSEKRIDDIGDLSLEQATSKEQNDRPSSTSNPRKRGAEGESGTLDPQIGGHTTGHMSARLRHGQNVPGSRDDDHVRQGVSPSDSDYRRSPSGPKQSLFNPNTDSPNTARAFQRETQHGNVNPIRHNPPNKELASGNQKVYLTGKDQTFNGPAKSSGRPWIQQSFRSTTGDQARPRLKSAQGPEGSSSESPPGEDFQEDEHPGSPEAEPEMLLQPETRPISHEQLVVEVKGIYAGLVMVEAKCIDIDERQSAAAQEKDPSKRTNLKNDQWQSLIALHKQLLHEHHDFFLASQHPSASPALSKLAAKYSMPARMWRHGIHAFLEVLRHRLPESLEHMLAFIYIAYSMMALLYETVPTFEDTWIECLGDLGRYRMAIEDDEPRDREVWSNVAKFWYNKASDKTPTVGRLYHHLAILARPYGLEQLSLYARSLTCVIPFESARGSIMTLFNPILYSKSSIPRRPSSLETIFIRVHAILFTKKSSDSPEEFNRCLDELEKDGLFEKYIIKTASKFKETGTYAAISNIAALFEYGNTGHGASVSILRLAFENAINLKQESGKSTLATSGKPVDLSPSSAGPLQSDAENAMLLEPNDSPLSIFQPSRLTCITLGICLQRPKDSNVYPLIHVYLGFLWSLIIVQQACRYLEQEVVLKAIEKDIPWIGVCLFLNHLATDPQAMTSKVRSETFPSNVQEAGRPLPEDYAIRGQPYTQWYFPAWWFTTTLIDDDERLHDLPSMTRPRKERLLWLGYQIASANRWIQFDKDKEEFSTTEYTRQILAPGFDYERASYDQDTAMSEADTVEDTPRSMSLAPSESVLSRASTRASTCASIPREVQNVAELDQPVTPKADAQIIAVDDVPMIDISPKRSPPVNSIADGGSEPRPIEIVTKDISHPR